MIDQISEAKSIKELQMSLLHRKSLISTPILTDLRQVNRIYEIFNQIDSYRNPDAIKGSVIQKKRFCFHVIDDVKYFPKIQSFLQKYDFLSFCIN